MIKPDWCVVKNTSLKLPRKIQLKDNLSADFDGVMNMISLERGTESIGRELFRKEKDFIKGIDIEIENPAEKRKGFGSLLRALSVMLMKENKAKSIKINSLPQALKFHYANGFRTDSGTVENATYCMRSIIQSNTPFDSLKKRAEKLHYRLSIKDKHAVKDADLTYDDFLKSVFEKGISFEDANFPNTVNMQLTLKDAVKNNRRFNKILKDYGIDYEI